MPSRLGSMVAEATAFRRESPQADPLLRAAATGIEYSGAEKQRTVLDSLFFLVYNVRIIPVSTI